MSHADLIVGTSAGAIVGARIASRMPIRQLIQAALEKSDGSKQSQPPAESNTPDLSFLSNELLKMQTSGKSQQSIRAAVGTWAQKTHPVISSAQFVESYRRRFPQTKWPSGALECVSVNASDGSLQVWKESSRVALPLAVASSCALPGVFAPVTINDKPYMDGGVRSVTNADLAKGCKVALILAPTVGPVDELARRFSWRFESEVQTLRVSGCKVNAITPDATSLSAFGPSLGDESRRAAAFNAGRTEGRSKASEIVY